MTFWGEIGFDDLQSRFRTGEFGEEMAALQLRADRWAAAQIVDPATRSRAAAQERRFRKERSVQRLLSRLREQPPIHPQWMQTAYDMKRNELKYRATRELAQVIVRLTTTTPGDTIREQAHEAAQATLNGLRERILNGESFDEAARELAARDSVSTGHLGTVLSDGTVQGARWRIPDRLLAAAFDLQKGDLSQPIRTENVWRLLYCIQATEERFMTFEEAKPHLTAYMNNEAYWMNIETALKGIRFQPGLQPEPSSAWVVPGLEEYLTRLPIEFFERELNATELLTGLWRVQQKRENAEDTAKVSWEKQHYRTAVLAGPAIGAIELPDPIAARATVPEVTEQAGQFLIIDADLPDEPVEEPAQDEQTEGENARSKALGVLIKDLNDALQHALSEEKSLAEIVDRTGWKRVNLQDIEPRFREVYSSTLSRLEIGGMSDAVAVGPYVGLVFRTPDVRIETKQSAAKTAIEYHKALLRYLQRRWDIPDGQ